GIGFIAISDASPGGAFVLQDKKGRQVATGTVDTMGSLIFRDLVQGRSYTVKDTDGTSGDPGSQRVTIREFDDAPPRSFFTGQTLGEGLQYIKTRDGTLLAAMVRAPLGKTLADGPFPTVVEYSGYPAADPDNPQPSTLIMSALGYATVGVNMRGS